MIFQMLLSPKTQVFMNFMILLSPKTQALKLLGCCYLLKLEF